MAGYKVKIMDKAGNFVASISTEAGSPEKAISNVRKNWAQIKFRRDPIALAIHKAKAKYLFVPQEIKPEPKTEPVAPAKSPPAEEQLELFSGWVSRNCRFAQGRSVGRTKTVGLGDLYAWAPKAAEALQEVQGGETSFSPGGSLLCSKLDKRGAWFVMDGHHRALEAIMRGDKTIEVKHSEDLPYIERTGGAWSNVLADLVRLIDSVPKKADGGEVEEGSGGSNNGGSMSLDEKDQIEIGIFSNWVRGNCKFAATDFPVMYHGSPSKRETLQAGSMLTTDITWAAGYTTRMNPDRPNEDEAVGTIHMVRLSPSNPFFLSGSLHDAESFLIGMAGPTGSLSSTARKAHEDSGFDVIIAKSRGKIVGAIPLVDVPVDDWIDPNEVFKTHYEDLPDNLKEIADRDKGEVEEAAGALMVSVGPIGEEVGISRLQSWARGNCKFASKIDDLRESNQGISDVHAQKFHELYEELAPRYGSKSKLSYGHSWEEEHDDLKVIMKHIFDMLLDDNAFIDGDDEKRSEMLHVMFEELAPHASPKAKLLFGKTWEEEPDSYKQLMVDVFSRMSDDIQNGVIK